MPVDYQEAQEIREETQIDDDEVGTAEEEHDREANIAGVTVRMSLN